MQKTFHLDPMRYELSDDGRVMRIDVVVHEIDAYNWTEEYVKVPSEYIVGAKGVLVSRTNVSWNAIRRGEAIPRYYLHFDLEGVPGNSDPTVKMTEGWRGTTNQGRRDSNREESSISHTYVRYDKQS